MRKIDVIVSDLKNYLCADIRLGEDGFYAEFEYDRIKYRVIFSYGMKWEHLSISLPGQNRCPIWDEMCNMKNLFWRDDETVVQYHPAKSEYVNLHSFVLHLWKPIGVEFPLPPKVCV